MIEEQKLTINHILTTYLLNNVTTKNTKIYLGLINGILDEMVVLDEKNLSDEMILEITLNKVINGSSYLVLSKDGGLKEYFNKMISNSFFGCENKSFCIEQLRFFFNTKFNNGLLKTQSELNFFIELYSIFNQTITQ